MSPGAEQVDQAVADLRAALDPAVDQDWGVPAGTLTWSCWQTATHVAHDLLAYAGQLAVRPPDAYLPYDLVVRAGTPPRDVLVVVSACAALLSNALRTADPGTRAWHWGPTDPSGFAALGVNEIVVHGYDIAQGLGLRWQPPADLCTSVLDRLFPDAPSGDPAAALLWCTGRIALPDRPRRTGWVPRAVLG